MHFVPVWLDRRFVVALLGVLLVSTATAPAAVVGHAGDHQPIDPACEESFEPEQLDTPDGDGVDGEANDGPAVTSDCEQPPIRFLT